MPAPEVITGAGTGMPGYGEVRTPPLRVEGMPNPLSAPRTLVTAGPAAADFALS